jgi:hypothetical protein
VGGTDLIFFEAFTRCVDGAGLGGEVVTNAGLPGGKCIYELESTGTARRGCERPSDRRTAAPRAKHDCRCESEGDLQA